MNAQQLVQAIFAELNIERGTISIPSADLDITQIVEFINQTGDELTRRADWSSLLVTKTLTGGAEEVALPDDWHRAAEGDPLIELASGNLVKPVDGASIWSMIRESATSDFYYFISGGQILFKATPADAGVRVTYVSKHWVDGGYSTIRDANSAFKLPARALQRGAIAKHRRQKGMADADYRAEMEAIIAQEFQAARA